MSDNELKQSRFNGLVDQIEFYLFKAADGFTLSIQQKKHLTELRDTVCVFGELGGMYAEECNKVLQNENL